MKTITTLTLYLVLAAGVLSTGLGVTASTDTEKRAGPCFARFVPERNDDLAWENDKVAFRMYGPHYRGKGVDSGIDCWLKRVEHPIIDKWYAANLKGMSYHEDHGEGYDPYHVGMSRGCGGLGLWIDGRLVPTKTFTKWKVLKQHGARAAFVLTYEWKHGGNQYREEKQISIEAGDRLFRVQSTFHKNGELAAGLPIAAGLTTHDGKARATADAQRGWMACWETIDGYGLGTGVVMAPQRIKAYKLVDSEEKDGSHALLITETDSRGQVEYAAGYGWEKAGDITREEQWIHYLKTWNGDRAAPAAVFDAESILALMRKVNEGTLAHPHMETDRNWIRATYYTGVMGAYHATRDQAYLDQARAWGKTHQWQVGTEGSGYNKLFCAMTWAELFLIDRDPAMLRPTIKWIETDAPNSPALGKIWYGHAPPPYDGPLYADSLYAASVFGLLHKATGEPRYLDLMHESFWTVTDKIFDEEEDLYYRDPGYIGKKTRHGKKILWSRGNGWVFSGLALLLPHLPEEDAERARYEDLFRRMAASIIARQHDDGLWRANLDDPDDYLMPESSGTAFFTHGLAWGIRAGLLDRETYLPAVIKGWRGLASCVHPNGLLGWVQPEDAQPRPSLPGSTQEYASGLFLLAGGEVLKLVRDGTISAESAAKHLVADDSILPPAAVTEGPMHTADHPLAAEINVFLDRQAQAEGFSPTGLGRNDYLDVIAGQVTAMRKYQDADGRIIDPVTRKEMYYATPCYAHSVAALAAAEHETGGALLESGMRALDISIESLAGNRAAMDHGDFFTWPVMFAYELFLPHASQERKKTWRRQLAAIDISKAYKFYRKPYQAHERGKFYGEYGKSWAHNWNLLNSAGEFLRARHGFTDLDYTDFCLAMQLPHFTRFGMYDETGSPLAYDLWSRHYAAGMLHRGYRSFNYTTYRDLLWKGAWTSLFIQSPFGELPTGHRSSHHIWNEAAQAVVFEIYAAHYARAGRAAEAGAFKRAAHLALQSVKSWIRPDGSGYIVKNRYPIEARHGYESYSAHTCYNMQTCSMLAQAWQFADESVAEKPCPADVGGFVVVLPAFHKVFANVGGNYVEYDPAADLKYNPTGLLRVHLKDGHPQLGPSDGCAPHFSGEGNYLAVGPAWRVDGKWTRLAECGGHTGQVTVIEETPQRVRFEVAYSGASQTFTVDKDGVTVEDTVTLDGVDAMRVYYPMLVFDGENETEVDMAGNTVTLSLGGRSVTLEVLQPADAVLRRTGKQLYHRNGLVQEVYAESAGTRMVYRITAE